MITNKITPSIDYNYWMKTNLIIVPKVFKPKNEKAYWVPVQYTAQKSD